MKRRMIAVGIGTMMLTLAGCGFGLSEAGSTSELPAAQTVEVTEAAAEKESNMYIEKSLAYLDQFGQGNFDPFYENVSDEFSGQITKEIFAAQWSAILQAYGRQETVLDKKATPQEGGYVVEISAVHTLKQMISTFAYNAKGQVAGSFVSFQPLSIEPQSADAWEEQPIQIGLGEKKLNGMLTLPKNVEKPPVMILLQGSGASNMNEQVGTGGNKPFQDIAHGLAGQGIATIRYDKRPYTYPEDMANVDVAMEYLDDAKSAVQLALHDERVDGTRIFLLGHSQGGMVGPEIVRLNPEIKGFVSLAGTLRRLEDLMAEQTKTMCENNQTMTEEQKKAQIEEVEKAAQQIKSLKQDDKTTVILGVGAAYWNSLNGIDSTSLVKQMEIPILVLQGEEDFQVPAAVDYPLWQEALSGKSNATLKSYPGLNHLFMKGGTKDVIDVSVYNTPANVESQVIKDIADWVTGI